MTDLPKAGITRNIGDRGIIGDLRSCALVAHDATIDYFCWPDLDSPSVCAALLDSEQAGLFSLQPDWSDARLQQLYLPDTNILQTRWLSHQGVAEVTDYMPIGDDTDRMPLIVRRLQVLKGSVNWRMRCAPMPDYARARPDARHHDGAVTFVTDGQPSLRLAASVALTCDEHAAMAAFALGPGEQATFVFGGTDDDRVAVENTDLLFAETLHYWQRWSARSNYS